MASILHITPHLGGGVGRVLMAFIGAEAIHRHTIATLDFANEPARIWAEQCGVTLISNAYADLVGLDAMIGASDIVVVHFWNHPLLMDVLINHPLPPARLVFWSHISGLEPPYVFTGRMLGYPDQFVFTTPVSFNAQVVRNSEYYDRFATVFSTGGIEQVRGVVPERHQGFVVGYVGTVDKIKMHPEYVAAHQALDMPDVRFLIVGGDREREIASEADSRFEFTGKVADVCPYLARMDVFGYLLNESHYGTGEQALQEAMAAGVVPVVLDNPTERLLVKHEVTGLVADNLAEYAANIKRLYHDTELRSALSANAKRYAETNFSLPALVSGWNSLYTQVLEFAKRPRRYDLKQYSPYEVFLESLGDCADVFVRNDIAEITRCLRTPEWQSASKGTPRHYRSFFPDDMFLQRLCRLYESKSNLSGCLINE